MNKREYFSELNWTVDFSTGMTYNTFKDGSIDCNSEMHFDEIDLYEVMDSLDNDQYNTFMSIHNQFYGVK